MHAQVDRIVSAVVVAAMAIGAPATAALGATYTFTNVADSSGPYQTFFTAPTISPGGVIAFQVIHDAGAREIVRRNLDGSTTVVAAVGVGDFTSFGQVQTAVNDAGQVAFFGVRPIAASGSGIFRADGSSPVATIATGAPAQHGSNQQLSVDAAGRVTFDGRNDDNSIAVFVGDGVTLKNLGVGSGRAPFIGPGGTVVFRGNPAGAGAGVYTTDDDGASFQTIALSGQSGLTGIPSMFPSVNATGTVAFVGETAAGGGGFAVFTGDGDGLQRIADDAGEFGSFFTADLTGPSINAAGDVAFFAQRDSPNAWGLYRGPDPVADKIIESGDALFGSTLVQGSYQATDLSIGNAALAGNGDVVFRYTLANGVGGIAVAHPVPEPACGLLAVAAAVGILGSSRVARRRR